MLVKHATLRVCSHKIVNVVRKRNMIHRPIGTHVAIIDSFILAHLIYVMGDSAAIYFLFWQPSLLF